jgi:hypothetical protein
MKARRAETVITSKSQTIRDSLSKSVSTQAGNAYTKDLHSPLIELEVALDAVERIVSKTRSFGYLEEADSAELKRRLNQAIELTYTFNERLGTFLSKYTLMKAYVGPGNRLKDILRARGKDVHVEAPTFSYGTDDGVYTCHEEGIADSYSGQCENISVEYKDRTGSPVYSNELGTMVQILRGEVVEMVSKFATRLNAIV